MKTVSWNTDTHKYFQKVMKTAGVWTCRTTKETNATPTVKATPTAKATPTVKASATVTDLYAVEELQNEPNVHIRWVFKKGSSYQCA